MLAAVNPAADQVPAHEELLRFQRPWTLSLSQGVYTPRSIPEFSSLFCLMVLLL